MQNATVSPASSSPPIWRQLRFNLIFTFAIITMVQILVVVILVIWQQITLLEAQAIRRLESVLELKTREIDLWLSQAPIALDYLLADNGAIPSNPASDTTPLINSLSNERLSRFVDANPNFNRFLVYQRDGEIVRSSDASDIGTSVAAQPNFAQSWTDTEGI